MAQGNSRVAHGARNAVHKLGARVSRLENGQAKTSAQVARMVSAQQQTNRYLVSINQTLKASARVFGLMETRLENIESAQNDLASGLEGLASRLDRLIGMNIRDRTEWAARFKHIDERLDAMSKPPTDPPARAP